MVFGHFKILLKDFHRREYKNFGALCIFFTHESVFSCQVNEMNGAFNIYLTSNNKSWYYALKFFSQ